METRAYALIREHNGHQYIDKSSIREFSADTLKLASGKHTIDPAVSLVVVEIKDAKEIKTLQVKEVSITDGLHAFNDAAPEVYKMLQLHLVHVPWIRAMLIW